MQDLSQFRPSRIWRRMPAERRLAASELFWADEQSTEQQMEAVAAIASHMKFRTKSVLGLAPEKRIKYLAGLPVISDTVAARALISYHLERQRPMMSAFLDSLEIAHENGLINDEALSKPDAAKLKKATAELASKYPPDEVSLYLSTLVSQDPDTWGELAELPETMNAESKA
jgi:hypothetical protein